MLLLLLPYIVWIIGQDRFDPRSVFAALVAMSVVTPIITTRLIRSRLKGTLASLGITPVVVCVVLYLFAKADGDREFLAWLPIIAAWVLLTTAPVWAVVSIVFGAMKTKYEKDSAEQQVGITRTQVSRALRVSLGPVTRHVGHDNE